MSNIFLSSACTSCKEQHVPHPAQNGSSSCFVQNSREEIVSAPTCSRKNIFLSLLLISCQNAVVKYLIVKRYLLYSLILHCLVAVAAFVFVREQVKRTPQPFAARIVTPEELQTVPQRPGTPPKRMRKVPAVPGDDLRERPAVIPQLPKNLPPPRELSSVPKGSRSEGSSEGTLQQRMPRDGQGGKERARPDNLAEGQGLDTKRPAETYDTIPERDATGESPGKASPGKPGPKTFREKFFDKEVIGDLAQADRSTDESSGMKQGSTITLDTKDYRYFGYMQRLKEKIEGIWNYPMDAAARGVYGDLYIRFTIKKDGRLGAVELVRTSGHKSLDEAAMRALRDAEPFWPLPESVKEDALTITGHFVYTLHGYYVR